MDYTYNSSILSLLVKVAEAFYSFPTILIQEVSELISI